MSLSLVRLFASTAVAVAACSGLHGGAVTRDGVELRRVDPAGTHAPGLTAGDFVLSAPALRVAIAGTGHRADHSADPGTVLFARVAGQGDPSATQDARLTVLVDGHEVPLAGEELTSLLVAGRPTLRMTASAHTPSGVALRITREYWLDPRSLALAVNTRVEHAGGPPAHVALGARLSWRAQPPFAPLLGTVQEPTHATAPWVGRTAGGAAFAWALRSGELALDFRPEGHHGAQLSGETDAEDAPRLLVAGRALSSFALLVAMRGDLGDAARVVARVRGERVRDVPVRVEAPDTAEGTVVTLTRTNGAPVLAAQVKRGITRWLPVPEGEYIAYAAAPGHTPADPVPFSARADTPLVDLALPPGGRIRFDARDSATGRALPVRVVVRGVDGTPDPRLGPASEASGANTIVVAPSGHGEFTVPPGHYALAFSHGPEWSVGRARTVVTPTLRGDVTVRLDHAVPMDDWTACDLHVHARPSFDSEVTVQDRVASLVSEGIEFATPTEHNIVGDYSAGVAALPPAARVGDGPGLVWVPAVEVTTDHAPLPVGHFNVYPYVPTPGAADGAPPSYLESPRQIFRAAHANNPDAIVQVNHPRMRPGIGYFDQAQLDTATNTSRSPLYDPNYDAIEIFNGYYLGAPPEVDTVLRDWFALLGSGARYVGTASSDSHTIAYHQAGYPRTYVYTPGAGDRSPEPSVVLAAIRAGHAFGTSGPMLFLRSGEAIPGDTVRVAAGATEASLEVRVLAAPWIDVDRVEIYRDGQLVATFPVPPSQRALRLEHTFTVPVTSARSFVVAVARGDGPMDLVLPTLNAVPFAFTNPIWFEREPH